MTTITRRLAALGVAGALLALAAPARAEEPWAAGDWTVDGGPTHRHLTRRRGGALGLEVPLGDGGEARVSGPDGPTLALSGELPASPGLVGGLEGRARVAPKRVEVRVTRGPDTPEGFETARALVTIDGDAVATERWVRPGAPRLEVVSLAGFGGGGFDPVTEHATLRLRVLGRRQRVTVRVVLPPGEGADDRAGRAAFYAAQHLAPAIATLGPFELSPGEHDLPWDGRDRGPARRIALSGRWTLSIDSAERAARRPRPDPVTATLTVSKPRLGVIEPRFTRANQFDPGALDHMRSDLRLRYRVETRARVAPEDFGDVVGDTAVTVIQTHGCDGTFALGDWRRDTLLHPSDLEGQPLRDVHCVFVFACRTGTPSEDGLDIGQSIVDAGADVVVLSTETLLIAESRPYHDTLAVRLLGYGHPIARAARDAAKLSYDLVWGAVSKEQREEWLEHPLRIRPLRDSLRFVTAPGIDAATERLVPARYGNSAN
jgi:hypothetical protein